MYGYELVCMGMYGYLDVMFLVPYFSIVVDVGSYIIGGPTTTMGIYGYVWVCTGMYEYIWICIGIYGYVWVSRCNIFGTLLFNCCRCWQLYNRRSNHYYGYVWVCMGMYGFIWVCMGIYGYVWVCMDMCGYVWVCMGMYGYV